MRPAGAVGLGGLLKDKEMRISRQEQMLRVSRTMGERGTCPRARVGCVIERDGRILSTGYNGSLPGEVHCDDVGCKMENGHCVRTIHAEANAICFAARCGIALQGATLYTTGWHSGSCPRCVLLAMAAGIKCIMIEGEDGSCVQQVP